MRVVICITLLALFTCAAWGQATAQMHGTVQDSSGAAVPGAEVKATQTDTGLARNVTSGADGGFVLTNLPLGPYQIEVSKEGFNKYVQSGIVLQVNSDPAIEAALKVGQVSEQVVVEANATQVETRSSGIGEVVQTQRIVDLPLNGRNVTDLITLAGGAVNLGNVRSSYFSNLPEISIAGQASSGEPFGTDYSLDGANHLNFMTSTTLPIAFPDAVQEFKVESSGQTAQHGAAAAITMVTRSGSNNFHGNLFEFLRNSDFGSAREYFSAGVFSYNRNQFGGTVGGPIMKNKLFFFAGFQGTTLRENPDNAITTVPTAQVLAGDWTTIEGLGCNPAGAKTLKAPFVGNMINPTSYSLPAVYIADKTLASLGGATPNQCGVITYNIPDHENDIQGVAKIDYQLNDKQSLFLRTLETHYLIENSFALTQNLLTAANTGLDQLAQSYAIGHTYVISSNVVQSIRLAYDRTADNNIQNHSFDFCQAGLQNFWCGANPGELGAVNITSGWNGGGTTGATGSFNAYGNSYSLNDDVNWVKGNHQIALGGGFLRGEWSSYNDFAGGGQFTFNGSVTGNGMADFFLGSPSSFFQGLPNESASAQLFFNLYATDSWRITPRLTFNYGLRWEPYLPMGVTNGQISNFSMARFLAGAADKSTVFVNAPYGFYFPGDPGFPGNTSIYKQWDHFDPRGGLAWDPKGDGKTSVRAGYAFGHAYVPGASRQDQAGSNPWGGRATFAQTGINFANPYATITGGNPYPYLITPTVQFTQAGQFITNDYNLPAPTTYSWNFSVQRQLGTWIISSTYIGSRMQHLAINQPINYAEIVGTIQPTASLCPATSITCSATSNTQARRVLSLLNPSQGQYVGYMDQWQPAGTQTYNGLLTSVQKRFSHGLSVNGNWTWSHCIGVFQGYDSKSDQTSTMYGNLNFDRGNCDADRRHIVNITMVYLTPKYSNKMVRYLASDWQVSGIYRFTSGIPMSVEDGTGVDRELSGIEHQRPNQILSDVYTGLSGPNQPYFNVSAFATACGATPTANCQPLGTFGSLGWNSVVGPTFWDMDMALSRIFHIYEKQTLEIRADAFNLTNSFVSMPPSTASPGSTAVPNFEGLSSSLFGINNVAQPTRKIQFALKYAF